MQFLSSGNNCQCGTYMSSKKYLPKSLSKAIMTTKFLMGCTTEGITCSSGLFRDPQQFFKVIDHHFPY